MPKQLSRKELEYMMDFEGSEYIDGYRRGFRDGQREQRRERDPGGRTLTYRDVGQPKPKRKLSAWNKFVKANSKKPRFRLRSGSPNLKKLGVAFRKTPAGKKKR